MTNVELEAVIKRLSRWTQVPDLGPLHQRNAQSASSLYNGHLPGTLQPKHITLAEPPQSIQQLVQPLLLRKNTKEFLLGQSGEDLGAQWLIILERVWLIMVFHGVVDAQRRVLEVVGEVAAFFLFPDLTKSQAESLGTKWRPVTPYSSTDLGSSLDADIVVGLPKVGHLKILLDLLPNREDSKVLSKIFDDLPREYLECILTVECNNIGDIRCHLTFLLLVRLIEDGKLDVSALWPQAECVGCAPFSNSHFYLCDPQPNLPLPEDDDTVPDPSQDCMGTQMIEFKKLLSELPPSSSMSETRAESPSGALYDLVKPSMQTLWDTGLHAYVKAENYSTFDHIMHWVVPSWHVFVRAWSQVVHHNLTSGLVASHSSCFSVQRTRKSGLAQISRLSQTKEETYFLRLVEHVVYAWQDAIKRSSKEKGSHIDRGTEEPHFQIISSPSVEAEIIVAVDGTDDDNTDSDDQTWVKDRKRKRETSQTSLHSEHYHGGSGKAPDREPEHKHQKTVHDTYTIMPKSLHLAFSCPTEHLQSSGFDHYTFIPPSCDSLQDAPTEHSCSGASSRSANASELWSPIPAASSDGTIPDLNVHVPNSTDPLLVDKVGVILDTKLNDQSSIGITWGGQMILEGVGSVEPVRVAVKLADRNFSEPDTEDTADEKSLGNARKLLLEAKAYQHLAQTDLVPRIYGSFHNSGAVALLLDHCGEHLDSFEGLTETQQNDLIEKVESLHQHGVSMPINAHNVLVDKGGNIRFCKPAAAYHT